MTTLQTPVAPGARIPPPLTDSKRAPRRRRWLRWALLAAAVIALAIALMWWRSSTSTPPLATQPVARGTLVQTVTATGTVIARDTVNVGTQVSGTISSLYVDYNSRVKVGQVLAKLDPVSFQAAVDRDQAQVAQAQGTAAASAATSRAAGATAQSSTANVAQAQANLASSQAAIGSADAQIAKARSARDVAQLTVNRDNQLSSKGYIAQSTVDTDRSNLAAAQAALSAAIVTAQQARLTANATQAQLSAQSSTAAASGDQTQASAATYAANQAAVQSAGAQLATDEINLQRTVITSPVNGTVIARSVSVGQTVAASFQTPTLFSIAEDLGQMELDLAVGEPDMGSVRTGQTIDFSVLAYPSTTFHATIAQVRQNPTTVNNVVTYTIVAYVNNKDGRLFPGMTASAAIHVAKATNALIVPIAALQYQPSGSGKRSHQRGSPGGSAAGAPGPGGPGTPGGPGGSSQWGQTGTASSSAIVAGANGRVFIQNTGGGMTRVPVHIDLVQGASAAVTPRDAPLSEGAQVVTGLLTASSSAQSTQSIFSPPRGGGGVPRSAR